MAASPFAEDQDAQLVSDTMIRELEIHHLPLIVATRCLFARLGLSTYCQKTCLTFVKIACALENPIMALWLYEKLLTMFGGPFFQVAAQEITSKIERSTAYSALPLRNIMARCGGVQVFCQILAPAMRAIGLSGGSVLEVCDVWMDLARKYKPNNKCQIEISYATFFAWGLKQGMSFFIVLSDLLDIVANFPPDGQPVMRHQLAAMFADRHVLATDLLTDVNFQAFAKEMTSIGLY